MTLPSEADLRACGFSSSTSEKAPTCVWTKLQLDARTSNLQQEQPLASTGSNMRSIVSFPHTDDTWWMHVVTRPTEGKPT